MLHNFLANNRDELIRRCIDKVAKRPKRNATEKQLRNGIPLFIEQLTRTLRVEQEHGIEAGKAISGKAGGDAADLSEMGESAAAHGSTLLELSYTVDQVVHDYGDLCQAVTDLAVERDAPFSVDEFRTLNRCLDNAIADAVTEFSSQRDALVAQQLSIDQNVRMGSVMHELRNSLQVAMMAFTALESGGLPVGGATGSVLKRGHLAMAKLIEHSLNEVRSAAAAPADHATFSLADFVAEAAQSAQFDADSRGCQFTILPVAPDIALEGSRELLLAALANLLHNAFKFTLPHSKVTLAAHVKSERVLIEVSDHCGGLLAGSAENMGSMPFTVELDGRRGKW